MPKVCLFMTVGLTIYFTSFHSVNGFFFTIPSRYYSLSISYMFLVFCNGLQIFMESLTWIPLMYSAGKYQNSRAITYDVLVHTKSLFIFSCCTKTQFRSPLLSRSISFLLFLVTKMVQFTKFFYRLNDYFIKQ